MKRHGVYVWGDDWVKAKTQAECYEYLFEAAVKLTTLGIDVSIPPPATHMNGNGKHIHQGKRAAGENFESICRGNLRYQVVLPNEFNDFSTCRTSCNFSVIFCRFQDITARSKIAKCKALFSVIELTHLQLKQWLICRGNAVNV